MYLKNIKASGFKSFADVTNIALFNNITCIVGPNGSGKSNIVDAIRWVLGEQSVKSLRGASSMSDIIFAGSKSRDKAPRSEVTLTFDNTDDYLNIKASEVDVKRVLYRSGESEYFINNQKVRLKDILDLFIDTGSGNDSFNIISQGSIESVVNSKPIERRTIFEEAAGVLKYKKRKEESLRKLEKTKDNISKVDLIIKELEVNLEPLKVQSENATRYLKLKEELKSIEVSSITNEITNINNNYQKLKDEIDILNEKILNEDKETSVDASNLETLKLKSIRLEEEINKTNQDLLTTTSNFLDLQNEKIMYTERKKYENSNLNTEDAIITIKEQILDLDKEINNLNEEVKILSDKENKINKELDNISEEESINKVKRANINNKYQTNMRLLFEKNNRIDILESSINNDEKMPYAVKNVLNNTRLKGVHNTIGKLISVKDEYANAIDIALGASTNFIVVDDEACAKNCINFLKENKLGRATFFPLNIIDEKTIYEPILKKIKDIKGFLGIASDLVEFDNTYLKIIKNQLGNVLVVDNIDTLNKIAPIIEYKYRIVSLDGEIMHAGGSITGGTNKNNTSIIKDKMDLESLKREKESLEKNNEVLLKDVESADVLINDLAAKLEKLNRENISIRESIHEKRSILDKKYQKQKELNKELEGRVALNEGYVDEKLMSLLESVTIAENDKNRLTITLAELKEEKSNLTSEIEELEHIYKEKNSNYNKLQNELKEKEIEIGKLDIKLDNLLVSLNENYNLTYENAKVLYELEVDANVAKKKISSLKNEIQALGDVNIFSIEEYERVSTRYNFLKSQKEDLELASTNLLNIISEMDTIMIDKFGKTFNLISEEFKTVFKKLFKGGNGSLTLTDPDNLLETGIEIIAEPPGKKLNSIGLLSGGEKTLTAIALLFAVLNVKTVPFCILDEVEAALDEVNVDAFGKYLQEYKKNSQFILITHKKKTMEYADTLYGITMQESGVSKIVSVKLEEVK